MKCRFSSATAALLLVVGAEAAHAQQVEPPPGPVDRARPDFEPVGGRVGNFILHPRAEARLEYSDNVFAAADGARSDTIGTLIGGVRLDSQFARHELRADAWVSQSIHGRFSSEDELEGSIRVDGRLDLSRRQVVRLTAQAEALAQGRYDINSIDQSREPIRYRRFSGSASYSHDLDPLSLSAGLSATRQTFSDAVVRSGEPLDESFRDFTYAEATLQLGYRVGPGLSLIAQGSLDRFDYDRDFHMTGVTATPFDRDSTGYKLEGGVRLELTRLIYGNLRAGFLHRDSDDARLPDIDGLSFGGELVWSVTPLTTVTLFADRSIEEGGLRDIAGNLRSQVALSVEHDLRRWLVITGSVRVARVRPVGPAESANELGLEATARYYLSRRVQISLEAQHFSRDDRVGIRGFSKNRVMLGVRIVL